jgi:hypothetical protein
MSLELMKNSGDRTSWEGFSEALVEVIRQIVREEVEEHWRWLTPEQAGELLGISQEAVVTRLRRDKLPGKRYEGRWYVDRKALDVAIAESPATLLQLRANPEQTIKGRAVPKHPRP